MPAKSLMQLHAMQAAAHGRSTLGIPKAVGAEFVAATPKGAKLPKTAHHPMTRAARTLQALNRKGAR